MVSSFSLLVTALSVASLARGLLLADTQHIFSFGDSYTADNYSVALGMNPTGPEQFLATTTGGYNWIQFLANMTEAGNAYYDLAVQGATVDNAIVDMGDIPSFQDQVDTFTTHFGENSTVKWNPETTLFTIFFLINDVGYSYYTPDLFSERMPYIMASYEAAVGKLYNAGARHFLFLGVPPTYRCPLVRAYENGTYVDSYKNNVDLANTALLTFLDNSFAMNYPLATERRFDTSLTFNDILDHPDSGYGIKVTDYPCMAYEELVNQPDAYDETCVYPLADFFWWNTYHPSWTVHKYLAASIKQFLSTTNGMKRVKRARGFGSNKPLDQVERR